MTEINLTKKEIAEATKRLIAEAGIDKEEAITDDYNNAAQIPAAEAADDKPGVQPSLSEADAIKGLRECYHDIIAFLRRYMDMSEENFRLVTTWIIGTYFHKQFSTYPFLFINAMRGSAKSRLLRIISALQFNGNGQIQNNISEAVTFRTAKDRGLILDEFEHIGSKEKGMLRELLNSAYKKGGNVSRMKKVKVSGQEKQVVETFDLYTPIALANIWGIEEVLADRCFNITLEKSGKPGVVKKIENFDNHPALNHIKQKLNELSVVMCSVVTGKNTIEAWNNYIDLNYPTTPISTTHEVTTHNYTHTLTTYNYNITQTEDEEMLKLFKQLDSANIDGRNLELCFPLIIISRFYGDKEFHEILETIKHIVKTKRTEDLAESKDISLYDFISKLDHLRFETIQVNTLTKDFREYLAEFDDEDKWLNPKWMGRALKRLNLIIKKQRASRGIEVMLNIDKAKEKMVHFKRHEIIEDGEDKKSDMQEDKIDLGERRKENKPITFTNRRLVAPDGAPHPHRASNILPEDEREKGVNNEINSMEDSD